MKTGRRWTWVVLWSKAAEALSTRLAKDVTFARDVLWSKVAEALSTRLAKDVTFARLAIIALAAVGVWQVASGTYIHAKAWLAQGLIASAWARTLEGERDVKPWPWADTWPIARLKVIDMNVDLYVLADASGRSLAFGPGYMSGTAAIGTGNTVIAGHRDTHFAFLRDLQQGDQLTIQTADGRKWHFELNETHIIDSRRERLQFDEGSATITLLTCYPFDAIVPGGPLRYAAVARIKSRAESS
jgi:sortase A